MHFPSVIKSHVFSETTQRLERHKLLTILLIILAFWLVYEVNISDKTFTLSSEPERPLTRLDDPQSAHEYRGRAQGIYDRLDLLRAHTRADRAYLVTYRHSFSPLNTAKEITISRTFEVGKHSLIPHIHEFQDIARSDWLHITRDGYGIWGVFLPTIRTGLGLELYNVYGTPVGYLGLNYLQGTPRVRGDAITRLRQTAIAMKASLLQPIEQTKIQEERR